MVTMAERMIRMETEQKALSVGQQTTNCKIDKLDGKLDTYVASIYEELKQKADKAEVAKIKELVEKNKDSIADLALRLSNLGAWLAVLTKMMGLW
jgi:hypothetical protein